MGRWTIFESFDPKSNNVYLDIVDASGKLPERGNLAVKELESFDDFRAAHAFLDGYIKAMKRGGENSISEIFCGEHEHPGCDVGPCSLGVPLDYRCKYRGRDKKNE